MSQSSQRRWIYDLELPSHVGMPTHADTPHPTLPLIFEVWARMSHPMTHFGVYGQVGAICRRGNKVDE
jgi:hypothetical protein